jgi:hypothetical protein
VDRQGEFMRLCNAMEPNERTRFVFNCYDAPNGSTARARFDDGPWREIPPLILSDSGVQKPHHWQLTVEANGLAPGSHTVEVRVAWPDGTEVRESKTFQVCEPIDVEPSSCEP